MRCLREPLKFSDNDIVALVHGVWGAKKPQNLNIMEFGQQVREAIATYRAARTPNEVYDEIEELWNLAKKVADGHTDKAPVVAKGFLSLSSEARDILNMRIERGVPVPSSADLTNPATAQEVANTLLALLQLGGTPKKGRSRPNGKQSRPSLAPVIWAPTPKRGWQRDREDALIIELGIIYLGATGKSPPRTAHPDNLGPWARMVKKVLNMAQSGHVDAVELVNKYGAMRRELSVSLEPLKS